MRRNRVGLYFVISVVFFVFENHSWAEPESIKHRRENQPKMQEGFVNQNENVVKKKQGLLGKDFSPDSTDAAPSQILQDRTSVAAPDEPVHPVPVIDVSKPLPVFTLRYYGDINGDGELNDGERWAVRSSDPRDEAIYRRDGEIKIDVRGRRDKKLSDAEFKQLLSGQEVEVHGRRLSLPQYQVTQHQNPENRKWIGQSPRSSPIEGVGPQGYLLVVGDDNFMYLIYEDAKRLKQGKGDTVRIKAIGSGLSIWVPKSIENKWDFFERFDAWLWGGEESPELKADGLTAGQILDALKAGNSVAVTSFNTRLKNDNPPIIHAVSEGDAMAWMLLTNYRGSLEDLSKREVGISGNQSKLTEFAFQVVDQLDINHTDQWEQIHSKLQVGRTIFNNGLVLRDLENGGVAYDYPTGLTLEYRKAQVGEGWIQIRRFRDGRVVEQSVLAFYRSQDATEHRVIYPDGTVRHWDAYGKETLLLSGWGQPSKADGDDE